MAQKLYRSRKEVMVAGVCGGLAEYFNIDPTIVRLIAVALTLAWGSGILAYLIFWIMIPQQKLNLQEVDAVPRSTQEPDPADKTVYDKDSSILLLGIVISVLGVIFLAGNFMSLAWLSFKKLWPILLIAIGFAIIMKGTSSKSHES